MSQETYIKSNSTPYVSDIIPYGKYTKDFFNNTSIKNNQETPIFDILNNTRIELEKLKNNVQKDDTERLLQQLSPITISEEYIDFLIKLDLSPKTKLQKALIEYNIYQKGINISQLIKSTNKNSPKSSIALLQFIRKYDGSHSYNDKIDGIWGPNTENAVSFTTNTGQKISKLEETSLIGCAEYVNKSIINNNKHMDNEIIKNQYGLKGHAWNLYHNIVTQCGGDSIYNIFPKKISTETQKNVGDTIDGNIQRQINRVLPKSMKEGSPKKRSEVKKYIESLYTKGIDFKKLQIGDVVGLYFPPSNNHLIAFEESLSGTCNTHVGYVIGINKNGIPIISHNIHGKIINVLANEINDINTDPNNKYDCTIVRAARPKIPKQ